MAVVDFVMPCGFDDLWACVFGLFGALDASFRRCDFPIMYGLAFKMRGLEKLLSFWKMSCMRSRKCLSELVPLGKDP